MKKTVIDKTLCVACGCCVKACPKGAVKIHKGITAIIDYTLCIGCGFCSKVCPASIITMEESE